MKKTGIILELNKKKAVIMTHDAGFVFIKREPGMFIGQQVDLNPQRIPALRPAGYGYLLGLASVAVIIFILVFVASFHQRADLYAYVTVDINPSIEFTVNKEIHVLSVRNLNKDGLTLLRGLNLKNMAMGKALLVLAQQAEEKHFFKKGKFMLISAATRDESGKEPEQLVRSIVHLKTELVAREIRVHFIKATLTQRKIALQNHLSMGRYALVASANTDGSQIGLHEAKTGSVASLLDKAGMLDQGSGWTEKPKKFIQGEKERNNLHPDGKTLSTQEYTGDKKKHDDVDSDTPANVLREKNSDGNDGDKSQTNTGPENGGINNNPAQDNHGAGNNDSTNDTAKNNKSNDVSNQSKENSPVSQSPDSGKSTNGTSSGSGNTGSITTGNSQKTGINKPKK